jgi:hypothetical protein
LISKPNIVGVLWDINRDRKGGLCGSPFCCSHH